MALDVVDEANERTTDRQDQSVSFVYPCLHRPFLCPYPEVLAEMGPDEMWKKGRSWDW